MAEQVDRQTHEVYQRLHDSEDFTELRKRYRGFAIPATVAFLVWYLLYVVLSNWAGDLMATKVVGNINVALIFGLLQFASTFLIALLYARYSNAKLDPLATRLEKRFVDETRRDGGER